ncbi:hypothetical protein ACFE04_027510 [Oxalis oulophora]
MTDRKAERTQQAIELEEARVDVTSKGKEHGEARAEVENLRGVASGLKVVTPEYGNEQLGDDLKSVAPRSFLNKEDLIINCLSGWEFDRHRRLHPCRIKLKYVTPEYGNE